MVDAPLVRRLDLRSQVDGRSCIGSKSNRPGIRRLRFPRSQIPGQYVRINCPCRFIQLPYTIPPASCCSCHPLSVIWARTVLNSISNLSCARKCVLEVVSKKRTTFANCGMGRWNNCFGERFWLRQTAICIMSVITARILGIFRRPALMGYAVYFCSPFLYNRYVRIHGPYIPLDFPWSHKLQAAIWSRSRSILHLLCLFPFITEGVLEQDKKKKKPCSLQVKSDITYQRRYTRPRGKYLNYIIQMQTIFDTDIVSGLCMRWFRNPHTCLLGLAEMEGQAVHLTKAGLLVCLAAA